MIIKRIDFDPDFQPVFFPSVLEHETISGLQKGGEIIARAKKEGTKIRKTAKEVLAQAVIEKEKERKRGFVEGVEEGKEELLGKILEASTAHEKILRQAEPQIVRMVMEIAEKVIGDALKKGAVVEVVKNAIDRSTGQKVVVKINPADIEMVRSREAEILSAIDREQSISVREDETVPSGGCIVETELGTVDARLETQLKAIRKALGI